MAVRSPYDFVIFLHPEKSHDARAIFTITVRAPNDVRTVASRSPCDMYNPTGIVRTPFGHPEVPVRSSQSVSFKIYVRRAFDVIVGCKEDDRDEDSINTCSRCEAGEPKAAAVAG